MRVDHQNTSCHKSTRVLHIFGQMNRGGAEMRTLDVMRSIDRDHFLLDYCVLTGQPGDLDAEIRDLGGEVHYCPLDAAFPLLFLRLLRKHKYDAVHSHVHFPSGLMLLLARIAGVPIRIAHFRTTGETIRGSALRNTRDGFLRSLINRFATNILAVSEGAMEASWTQFIEADGRCRVIYNGIDSSRYVGIDKETSAKIRLELGLHMKSPVFIHVGRFTAAKNHPRLIDILELIHQREPNSALVLVGAGNSQIEQEIRTQVASRGLAHAVVFAGLRDDVPALLSISDCMIFPSLWEGLPGVVLEATAAGVPVLASDISGVKEISKYFQSVRPISLELSDRDWATQALVAVDGEVVAEIEDSPFSLECVKEQLMTVWRGGESNPAASEQNA